MGGRGSSSGMSSGLSKVGLQRESSVDVDRYDFYDTRFGRYAYELADEMDQFGDDSLLVSFTSGRNKAYAAIDTDSDTLEGIVSDGGGAGTQLLKRVMQYQSSKGKGLSWMADNPKSDGYYKSLGLGKYATRSRGVALYHVPPSKMADAIKIVNRRKR